jgi:hypothetical protein
LCGVVGLAEYLSLFLLVEMRAIVAQVALVLGNYTGLLDRHIALEPHYMLDNFEWSA